jgi:hypothetical protein
MQQLPDANQLLADIAQLLESEVIDAVQDPLRHRVRVAANLARIMEREVRLGPAANETERQRLALVLGDSASSVTELREQLIARLQDPEPMGAPMTRSVYDALLATVRADLDIARPGYTEWTEEPA